MKNKNIFVIAIVLASLLVTPAFAACTNVCDTNNQYSCSKSTSTLTKGTSATLTATITNRQSEAVTSLGAALQGSWFTSSSSSTTIASIQASGTGNADFSITPTSTGGQDVCVALGSTCTADCGTVTVESPASLGVTSLSAPGSVQLSSLVLFTVSTTIQNSGTETAGSQSATTATLSSSNSNCVVTSPTKTIGTITGSSQNSVSWSVSTENSGSCTLTVITSASPGGTATSSKSVTITAAAVAAAAAAAGGGGGGGSVNDTKNKTISRAVEINGTKIVTEKGKNAITIPAIAKDTVALVNVDPAETDIRKIAFAVANAVSNVSIVVSKLERKPAGVTDLTGKLFSYLQIDKNIADNDISSATIEFQVDKTWLSANKIDKASVVLNRFSGNAWAKLSTKQVDETSTHAIYQAESSGLSVFAITGSELPAAQPTTTTVAPVELPQVIKDYGIWIVIFVIAAVALGYLYYHGHHHVKKATGYVFEPKKEKKKN